MRSIVNQDRRGDRCYLPVAELVTGSLLLVVPVALFTPVAPVAPEFQLEVPPVVLGVCTELPVDVALLEPLIESVFAGVSHAARPKVIMPAISAVPIVRFIVVSLMIKLSYHQAGPCRRE
jgi:hypothetical protein